MQKESVVRNWAWYIFIGLMGIGILLCPIHVRAPFLEKLIGQEAAFANYFMLLGMILLLLTKRDYTKMEIVLCVVWLLLLIPIFRSNTSAKRLPMRLPEIINCWLPIFLLQQRMPRGRRVKWIGVIIALFDIFILGLLLLGIYEKMSDQNFFAHMLGWYGRRGFVTKEFTNYVSLMSPTSFRFFSPWGHPLTNALLFNAFFIINDIYFRSIDRKYPKLLFFAVAMVGVLLCAAKTAIVVLGAYLVISSFEQPLMYVVYAAAAAGAWYMGLFERVLYRFTHGSLTSGRVDALIIYFTEGNKRPLLWFRGYGASSSYGKYTRHVFPAFEFPLMMFALDLGIVFSVVFLGTMFLYYSYHLLKRKQIVMWLGVSLFFAQINTYNGISYRSQDMGWFLCIFLMLAMNCAGIATEENLGHRRLTKEEKEIRRERIAWNKEWVKRHKAEKRER